MIFPSYCTDLPNWRTVFSITPPAVRTILAAYETKNKAPGQEPLNEYRDAWLRWLSFKPTLNFSGCERKQKWAPCNGIHDALVNQLAHKAYQFNQVVCFTDDYLFYQVLYRPYRNFLARWDQLDLIPANSYVIVSWPNHRGMLNDDLNRLISHCQATNSKIFLDCAFYGTVNNGICDTSLDVFDAVAFSLSKALHCGGLRSGIVFGDELAPALTVPVSQHYDYNYYNINAVQCGTEILNATVPDFVPRWFGPLQQTWCRENGCTPADVVLFGLDYFPEYKPLWRQGSDNLRICLTDYYQTKVT
jgi:hypothetical protein